MKRYLLAIVAFFTCVAPAFADWPTTSFLPVPVGTTPVPDGQNAPDPVIAGGFEGYAEGADTLFNFTGATMSVETLDIGALRKGAVAALTDLFRLISFDARKLEAAGFPAPLIEPLLTVRSTGEIYYPLFWANGVGAPMKRGCYGVDHFLGLHQTPRNAILVSNSAFAYADLDGAWRAGDRRRKTMLGYTSATAIHEVVHAIQAQVLQKDGGCGPDAPKWLSEGMADGIAYYLLSKRLSDTFEFFRFARNERRYDVRLTSASWQSADSQYSYGTGSFFRYLMEASEGSEADGLAMARDIVAIPPASVTSNAAILDALDDVVKRHASGRGLYRVMPEFFTEYASYGESRYKSDEISPAATGTLTHEKWIDQAFDHCVEVALTPGATIDERVEVHLDPLAAECIHVSWSGFQLPVALQLFAEGAGDRYGDLHLGEAVREDQGGTRYCYDVTRSLSQRIGRKMSEKCMLRRGAVTIGGGSGAGQVAEWTSDFNVVGDGEVYFILSNVAKSPAQTQELALDFVIGTLAVESAGTQITPEKPAGTPPVRNGMTDLKTRVVATTGAGDRLLFDGRSVFGAGLELGFLTAVPGAQGIGNRAATFVRGGNYWVWLLRDASGGLSGKEGAFVIRNPPGAGGGLGSLGGMAAAAGMPTGMAMSGALIGVPPEQKCGVNLKGRVTIMEHSHGRVRFRIEADLLDMSRLMARPGKSACQMIQAAFVEHADFVVTLPYGDLYAATTSVERGRPAGQELYDETEFPAGPSFGGIETSASLVLSTAPPSPAPTDGSGDGPSAGGGTSQSQCACSCTPAANPGTPACAAECAASLAACDGVEQSADTAEAPSDYLATFKELIETQDVSAEEASILIDDFSNLSPATRDYFLEAYRK